MSDRLMPARETLSPVGGEGDLASLRRRLAGEYEALGMEVFEGEADGRAFGMAYAARIEAIRRLRGRIVSLEGDVPPAADASRPDGGEGRSVPAASSDDAVARVPAGPAAPEPIVPEPAAPAPAPPVPATSAPVAPSPGEAGAGADMARPVPPLGGADQGLPRMCPRCGAPYPDDMSFCMECGTRLVSRPPAPAPAPSRPQGSPEPGEAVQAGPAPVVGLSTEPPRPQSRPEGDAPAVRRTCPHCGSPLGPKDAFCGWCGKRADS